MSSKAGPSASKPVQATTGSSVVRVYPFLGEGSPTKTDYGKNGYPLSNLATGGPRLGTEFTHPPPKGKRIHPPEFEVAITHAGSLRVQATRYTWWFLPVSLLQW